MTICALQLGAAQQPSKGGAVYGTRAPETCASTKEPAKGAPSPEVAKRYLRCHLEGVGAGSSMYLLENVKVEVGKGTPFVELPLSSRPFGGDSDGLVYQIRGSYTQYQCSALSAILKNAGKNCRTYENKHATGTCFRTGFGDWICNMSDLNSIHEPENRTDVAPPR